MNTALRRPLPRSGTILVLVATATAFQAQAVADIFGTGANTFAIDFVTIGCPGNPADTTGAPNPAGSVAYSFRMGTYEVSRDMVSKANHLGGLGVVMMDMSRYGGNGVNRPATGITWLGAAAFVNWLNTSTGHRAAYNIFEGYLSLWPSGEAWVSGGETLYRHKDTYYFLPSDNEWYKAAFYDGEHRVYYDYATGSNSMPIPVAGGAAAGTAVYEQLSPLGPADVANAGGLSPFGTMGQGGNVFEWMESAKDGSNDSPTEAHAVRGGYWFKPLYALQSTYRYGSLPTEGSAINGFRVASVLEPGGGAIPEPAVFGQGMGLVAVGFALWRRRNSAPSDC
jgi:formylglycine-generating enzyme required for sulfatase activity